MGWLLVSTQRVWETICGAVTNLGEEILGEKILNEKIYPVVQNPLTPSPPPHKLKLSETLGLQVWVGPDSPLPQNGNCQRLWISENTPSHCGKLSDSGTLYFSGPEYPPLLKWKVVRFGDFGFQWSRIHPHPHLQNVREELCAGY